MSNYASKNTPFPKTPISATQTWKTQPPPPEIMKVADLLHAQPTEFRSAHGAHHVIARSVVHLHDQDLAPRARLDVVPCESNITTDSTPLCELTMLRILAVRDRRRPDIRRTLRPRRVARLVGVPLGLAMVTEVRVAAWTQALQLGAAGALAGYHSKTATESDHLEERGWNEGAYPQSGAGHHLVSGSTAKTLLTMKSSYFSKSAASSMILRISTILPMKKRIVRRRKRYRLGASARSTPGKICILEIR